MYKAMGYVDTGKRVYAPGEIIEDDPNASWHLKVGAIRKYEEPVNETGSSPVPVNEMTEDMADVHAAHDSEDDADPTPVSGDGSDNYAEPEAPEIDVMDAIITGDAKSKGRAKGKRKGGDGA